MCGITGALTGRPGDSRLLDAIGVMTESVRHRGPDDGDTWVDRVAGVALGHRRLAIIDLSPLGHQPMISASGRYRIVFNGEVYNFAELRGQLEALGHQFRGHSDTEIMLGAFEAWGLEDALKRFVGMFAFALWDAKERRLHLVRDRLGIKPVYYAFGARGLAFGSELKALRAAGIGETVDRLSLALFLKHGYIPGSRTIYEGVKKLEPGSILSVSAEVPFEHGAVIARYWHVPPSRPEGEGYTDPVQAVEQLDALIRRAVLDRLVADVPLGAFLSGGIDSSVVVGAMQSQCGAAVKTFSIGFSEAAFDEAQYARRVAAHLGTEHTELYVSPKAAQDVIPLLPGMFDEPFADASQIPTYLVSKLARQSVTVSLSGDGGDELFFGYSKYESALRWQRRLARVPRPVRVALGGTLSAMVVPGRRQGLLRSRAEMTADLLRRVDPVQLFEYFASLWKFPERVVERLPQRIPPLIDGPPAETAEGFLELMSYIDLRSYLPEDILTKVDRASMAVALEARVPLLDHRVVEYAARLPSSLKIRDGLSKWALRQVLYKYVPRELVDRPKMGFGVPIGEWLRGPLRDWAESLLDEAGMRSEGYLNAAAVRAVWREHLQGRFDWQYPLWNALTFQAWLRSPRASGNAS